MTTSCTQQALLVAAWETRNPNRKAGGIGGSSQCPLACPPALGNGGGAARLRPGPRVGLQATQATDGACVPSVARPETPGEIRGIFSLEGSGCWAWQTSSFCPAAWEAHPCAHTSQLMLIKSCGFRGSTRHPETSGILPPASAFAPVTGVHVEAEAGSVTFRQP